MFDPYSQMSAHARKQAFLHPEKLTTWQDALRENRDTDLDPQRQSLSSEGVPHTFLASLRARFQQWRSNWWLQPSREAATSRRDLAPSRHSPARR
jgi:hypothetical protein